MKQMTPNYATRQQRAALARQMQHRVMGIFQLIGAVLCVFTDSIITITNPYFAAYGTNEIAELVSKCLKRIIILLPGGILALLLSNAGGKYEGSIRWNQLLAATGIACSYALMEIIFILLDLFKDLANQVRVNFTDVANICITCYVMHVYIGQLGLCLLRARIFTFCKDNDTEAQSAKRTSAADVAKTDRPNETMTTNENEQKSAESNPATVDVNSDPTVAVTASNDDEQKPTKSNPLRADAHSTPNNINSAPNDVKSPPNAATRSNDDATKSTESNPTTVDVNSAPQNPTTTSNDDEQQVNK